METIYDRREVPEGTHMALRNRGNPSGFAWLAAPLMAAAVRRATQADLRELKARLESKA